MKKRRRKWPHPGSLVGIPLGGDAWALGQILPIATNLGIVDRVFRRRPRPEDIDPTTEASAAIVYDLGTGFDENGWVVVGTAPFVEAFKKRVVRWRRVVARSGFMVGERDPFDQGGVPDVYMEGLPNVAEPDSLEHHPLVSPPLIAAYLQNRFGLPKLPVPNDIAPIEVSPRDELLDHTVVAELRGDAESDPKGARTLLVGNAREAFAADGFLDSEIGTPALVAACATKDAKMARAFRATPKSLAKLVPNAKAVASRVLDPKTSELAQLHQESGTLAALVAYVDGLALE